MNHSPEPWSVFDMDPHNDPLILGNGSQPVGSMRKAEDARRVTACVNAMQGIEDPVAFMEQYEYAALWLKKRHWKTRGREFGE